MTSALRRSSAVQASTSARRRSSVRRWRADSPACLNLVVRWLGRRAESLIEVRGEPQVVGRKQPHHCFVQPSGRQHSRHVSRRPEPLADARHPRVDRRRRRLRWSHAPHFVQHQHAIDESRQSSGDPIGARRHFHEAEIDRGLDVRERHDLARQDGKHAVDNLRSDADRLRARAEGRRAESKEPGRVAHARACDARLPLCSLPSALSASVPSECLPQTDVQCGPPFEVVVRRHLSPIELHPEVDANRSHRRTVPQAEPHGAARLRHAEFLHKQGHVAGVDERHRTKSTDEPEYGARRSGR